METTTAPTFSSEELQRYSRQIALPEIGQAGQERLKNGRVLVIGAGGLGSPALLYLASAGVGNIGVADYDVVDLTNLQRQVIHDMTRLGDPKVESAVARMIDINPSIKYHSRNRRITETEMEELLQRYDFVIDATDSFESKFMINDTCVAAGVPLCYGGIRHFEGQLMTITPGNANLRDLFENPPKKKELPIGPLGVVPGVIGVLQAAEALKYLLGLGHLLENTLLTYNALTATFRRIRVKHS